MVAEIIVGLLFLALTWGLFSLFLKNYDIRKEKQFNYILNKDVQLDVFNTGKNKEYTIHFRNKKGNKDKYSVWANSKEQAKILFLEETGESYLRILNVI